MRVPPQTEAWRWPIDTTAYDRAPELSSEEQAHLLEFVQRGPRSPWFARVQETLPRLVVPLCEALAVFPLFRAQEMALVKLFLNQMHQEQRAYWAMTEAEYQVFLDTGWQQYARTISQLHLVGMVYVLGLFRPVHLVPGLKATPLAAQIFGQARFERVLQTVSNVLSQQGYSDLCASQLYMPLILGKALLVAGSPRLEDLSIKQLESMYHASPKGNHRGALHRLSQALYHLKIIEQPLPIPQGRGLSPVGMLADVHPEWARWCERWRETSTLSPEVRKTIYRILLQVGRWLHAEHPGITSPAEWTRELAVECVAMVSQLHTGQWTNSAWEAAEHRPLKAATKDGHLSALRTFFRDCQAWEWIPRRLDPQRSFSTPSSILAQMGPRPRVIADEVWARLLWAGLNLTQEDLLTERTRNGEGAAYPLEMVRAIAITWLFGGLRTNELRRLRLGCVHWQGQPDGPPVCILTIPVNKTGAAFAKPIDPVVGRAIQSWEAARPVSRSAPDPKTHEVTQRVFSYRGVTLGKSYINEVIIPLLCEKAGVPTEDGRGRITSHRARSTIASQLYNAREGMSLFELQAWLGHRTPESTQYYVRVTPTRQMQAYQEAAYLERNLRLIEVLVDPDAIQHGAAEGEAWRYVDVGPGHCTYDFFEQCAHRLACARCDFFVAKQSSKGQWLEARTNLQRTLETVSLTETERAAVEDGVLVVEKLTALLEHVPTPSGRPPNAFVHRGESIP